SRSDRTIGASCACSSLGARGSPAARRWPQFAPCPTPNGSTRVGGAMFLFLLAACSKDGGVNIFSVQDDIDLGAQLAAEIESDPKNYPLLDEAQFPDAYDHLYALRDAILATGEVDHADDFTWELHIIDDPKTLNAFCAPGGYIYV